ncbi:S24 family peptidase [Kaistia algarum]|uniref:S24 family peptidase n=1 Tax=Kaistia algarum TaxID=2083279 RepID=UPI002254683F|nr:S24 family peptidase [Kaistia algarum]
MILGEEPRKAPIAELDDRASTDGRRIVPPGREFDPDPEFDPDGGAAFSPAEPYRPAIPGASPELDGKPGAGLGMAGQEFGIESKGIVTGHRVVAEWVFPPDYLRHELGARPGSIVIMEVVGDSMKGTLDPGDRVLVDTGQNAFGEDAVYVFDDGDGTPRVKRLNKVHFSDPRAVAIISDNPAARREERAELDNLRIIGRVVGRVTRM